jgi:hypothetical protein
MQESIYLKIMNHILNYRIAKVGLVLLAMVLPVLLLTSCSKRVRFLSSAVVPAAKGSVKISTDQNKNYVLEIEIVDLADASRLQPPKESYVAWMETEKGDMVKLGQLNSKSGFMSKQMKATMKTVSSFKPSKVFVTAENKSNVQSPDKLVILTTPKF